MTMDSAAVIPLRLEGPPELMTFAREHADAHGAERSDPITADETFGSPQSAVTGAIVQNLQMIDMVFKTSTDALTFLTALAAFVHLPDFHGAVAVKNARNDKVLDPATTPDRHALEKFVEPT